MVRFDGLNFLFSPATYFRKMSRHQRINKRLFLRVATVIVALTGEPLAECIVEDISATGARITVGMPELVPDYFRLTLETRRDILSPKCGVRWRSGHEIGVEFLKRA